MQTHTLNKSDNKIGCPICTNNIQLDYWKIAAKLEFFCCPICWYVGRIEYKNDL